MAISQATQTLADGNVDIEITVPFIVAPPPDSECSTNTPNILNLAPSQATTGGSLAGGHNFYYVIVAIDSASLMSPASKIIEVVVPAGTNTNEITLSGITPFDSNAVKYAVYRAEDDPTALLQIQAPTAIPAGGTFTFTDTGLSTANVLPPDESLAKTRVYWMLSGGTFWTLGAETADRSGTSLTFAVPLNVGGQNIEIQLRSVSLDGTETPNISAPTTTYAVVSPSPLIIDGAHASYRPLSNPLTGHDAGTSATVNVAAFTMGVAGFNVSINSGSITGLFYNTLYFIYYDDPSYAGGSVSFQATTAKTQVLNSANRFFVGSILTPLQSEPDTVGNNDGGAGAQTGTQFVMPFTATAVVGVTGNGACSNAANAIDGDPTTFANINATGNGSFNNASLEALTPNNFLTNFTSLQVRVLASVPTNSLNAAGGGCTTATVTIPGVGAWVLTGLDSLAAGTTLAKQYFYATLTAPSNSNLNLQEMVVKISADCGSGPTASSGSLQVNVYDVEIVGVV